MLDEIPATLLEAVRYFSDIENCNHFMAEIKWPNGKIVCPKCGNESCHELASRKGTLKCNKAACQKQFSYKVGTIFEDSPLGLDKWFVAIWSIANCKNGISSHELGRALGVTQKTAWFMLHRIRKAMESGSFEKLAGEVESDETFIGGKAANMHKAVRERKIQGRGSVGKTPVQGLVERGGRIKTFVIPGATADVLQGNVLMNVQKDSHLYTDEATAYAGLIAAYVHQTVNHGVGEYVKGRTHTNTLECFWSLLNRALKGTYTHVEPFHLHRYTTEQAFRWNEREHNDALRFLLVLRGVLGKRLTYRKLAAIGDAGFMGLE